MKLRQQLRVAEDALERWLMDGHARIGARRSRHRVDDGFAQLL